MRQLKPLIYSIPLSLVLVIFTWQGCDNVILDDSALDKRPNGFTEESYFNTESEFESGIFGIYEKMSDKYWFNAGNPIHGLWHLPGDDITSQRDNEFETFGPLDPENGHVQLYWTALYQVINRANIMLEKLDNEDGIYETANLKDYHRGEAQFLRAWATFEIWNYWGAHAPLQLEVIREADNVNSPSSNTDDPWGTELLDQAIADLRDAADLLPPAWDDENLGRAITNSANGLLEQDPDRNLIFSWHPWDPGDQEERITRAMEHSIEFDIPFIIGEFSHTTVGLKGAYHTATSWRRRSVWASDGWPGHGVRAMRIVRPWT